MDAALDSHEGIECRSEFARVSVRLDRSANGPRLEVTDLKSGRTACFDPLELECLAWTRHEHLADFLNPGVSRWADPEV